MGQTFLTDLETGHKAEDWVLEELKGEFPTLHKTEGLNSHADLIDDNGYSIEVKYDKRSSDTGNVAIEYNHGETPSGISTSKAMEWIVIYYLKGTGWVYARAKTSELRAFVKNNKEYFETYDGTGDRGDLILVPAHLFADAFNYYKILDKGQGRE